MPHRRRHVLTAVLVVLLAVLLSAASTVGWLVWGTTWRAERHARTTVAQAASDWPAGVVAILSIPSLGVEWPVADSVSSAALGAGMGWYPASAKPGQVGNCAIAGQRITHGAPFAHLLDLRTGETVDLTTKTKRFTYRVVVAPASLTVASDASWVLDPVPGHPSLVPSTAILTLTTAQDLWDSDDRAVAFATLVSTTKR